jgi:hypothetical protein
MVEKSDFPPASGQLLVHRSESSREPDLDTTLRFAPRVEPQAAGPSSQRGATMMLPDSRRDPSCIQALGGAPVSERTPRPGFVPVPRTQLLGTRGPEGISDPLADKAARAGASSSAADAAHDSDLPPPRSIIRSRPWVEIPDGASSGIRSMPELEANAPSMVEEPPAPPSRRFGRARRAVSNGLAAPQGPDAGSLKDSPPMSSPRVASLPSDPTGSLTIPGVSDARARRERLIFGITAGGAILSVIGVSIWLWGSGDKLPSATAARQGATLEALAPATAAPAAPPPRPAAAAKATGDATSRPTVEASSQAPAASPPTLQRKGQRPPPAGAAPRSRSQNEVVDPWDN